MAKQKYRVRLISVGTDAERQKVMDETIKYLIDAMAEIVVAKHSRPSERGAKYCSGQLKTCCDKKGIVF